MLTCEDWRGMEPTMPSERTDFEPPLRVEVLGPLRLLVDGAPVDVPGPKRRTVLALMAMAEGRVVPVDRLLDALWPNDPPEAARAALHSHVSRLRRHLGPAAPRLESFQGGYRLALDAHDVDARQARGLLAQARTTAASDPARAAALLRQARSLWRGPPLPELGAVPPIAAWSVALDELRREVGDLLVACALDAGETDDVVELAADAVADDTLREPAVVLLMRAYAATARSAEALRIGYEFRRRLADESGLEPSPALGAVEREIATGATPGATHHRTGAVLPPVGRLVGRDSEMAALHRLLAHERLVTVVGPGGVGKTRLAAEIARRSDDVTVLPLAPVTDPAGIPHALASALDLDAARGDVLSTCVALLGAVPRLLVLDNCEHLRAPVRDAVDTLTAGCPELRVLATSREPLGLPIERLFRLAPLPLPRPDDTDIERVPAAAVFMDRARRTRRDFTPTPPELALIGDIVRRLDGMPLAIELAAGRLSSFAVADLHTRLDRALDFLGDHRFADARHRSLRATIEWSYTLLSEQEQRLFRHLAIFPDGVDLTTAEAVGTELGVRGDPAGILSQLVDASMIDAHFEVPVHYRMLETVRSFGIDRLIGEGERDAAEDELIRWAVDLAARIDADQATWREPEADTLLRRELPNLRAAWHLARRRGRLDDAIDLAIDLDEICGMRDLSEVWSWSRELAEEVAVQAHPRGAAVLGTAAGNAWITGDATRVETLARSGLEIATDDDGQWRCLLALSYVAMSTGTYEDAADLAVEAATLSDRPAFKYAIAALAAAYGGDPDRATALSQQAATTATAPSLRAWSEYVAGEIDNAAGRHHLAEQHYVRAIELARSAGATFVDGVASVGLLTVRADAGRVGEALHGYRELVEYWEHTGSWIQQWTTLRNLARLLHGLGDHEPALFLEVAADHAPEAAAVSDAVWTAPVSAARALDDATVSRIRDDASSCPRAAVLHAARQAIERHLEGSADISGDLVSPSSPSH
jgi:predicted ATPase/DNA-binding SARP family transcriptional activator